MTTDLRTVWEGHYFDGRTPLRRPVTVTIMRGGLSLARQGASPVWWPFPEVRQAQGGRPGEPVRLERGADLPEVLVVDDPGFLAAVRAIAPEVQGRITAARTRGARRAIVLASAAGAVVVGALLYFWVIPFAAEVVAGWVPIAWEEELGRAVVEGVGLGDLRRCGSPAGTAALDRMSAALLGATPGEGYTYRLAVVDAPVVNALAAPGGYVVVFDGLLREAGSPEELAGVLAHELQHVERRHGTKMLVREVSAAALLAAATGDATQFATVLGAAKAFGRLHFSREAEREADERGMRMIQAARIDPHAMVRFMARLGEKHEEVPRAVGYLSTHPLSSERVARLERLAREATYDPVPLLEPEAWRALREICGEAKAGERGSSDAAAPAGARP